MSLHAASPRWARCSAQPAIPMRWTAIPAALAAAPRRRLRQTLQPWAWAATPVVRSASPPFTTAWWASAGPKGWQAAAGIIPLSSTQDIGGPIGRSVTDIAIVLDAIVGYDPADPQTAASVGNIPKSYTDYLQLAGLRGARIGLLTDLLGSEPEEAEVAMIVRWAIKEMNGQGAQGH